ncbi:putative pentatricopeptide repeat-containing protein At1g74580 [Mercurialis annua]|uniref:putative pentatricopeptide repeat-containing protein At1g74580 n=1 Tax=Mercurialis annua TaxID=3986 RepID=UPI00215DF845|nr:putative pentatricopeptide repeat-containing protein At1g74580 [Mercurialis annua]
MASKTLAYHPQAAKFTPLITDITTCLLNLNPQSPNPSRINKSLLNQFSSQLHPELVIQVIKKQSNPYHALFFFNWASNPSPNPKNYVHSHHCYVAITDHLLSHSIFDAASSLLENANRFSDLMASKFIIAYGNHRNVDKAMDWFCKAKTFGNGNVLFSYNAILNVLVDGGRISLAQSIFDEMVRSVSVKPDVSSYCVMIKGYCRIGKFENAWKVFDEMSEPNLVCYNTMINGYCKKGDMKKAKEVLYRLMESKHCLPDAVSYTTLIDGYCKKGELDEAMKWMSEMKIRCCKPNLLTYNALIYGLCMKGDVDKAKRLMTEMRLNGVRENFSTHLSILKGFSWAGKSVEGVNYFREMIRKGMKPDAKAYAIVINGYCKIRKLNEAIALLKEMQAKGIHPSVSSFNAVFRILMELEEFDTAIFLVRKMKAMGCRPNLVSYDIVISGLCNTKGRMQNVKELLDNMFHNGLACDAAMYNSLVKGYCENGNEEVARLVFYEAIDKNYVVNTESFSVFVKKLCENGKAFQVENMFEEMCKRCCVADVDSYRRILDEQLVAYSSGGS